MGRGIVCISILTATLIACESGGSHKIEHRLAKAQPSPSGELESASEADPEPMRAEAPPAEAAANPEPSAEPIFLPTPIVPFRIVSVDLGKEIDDRNAVSDPTAIFAATDTIYASVATDGQAFEKKLEAHWSFESGETIADDSRAISPSGPARLAFQVAHPESWPVGRYKLEMRVDGEPAEAREFVVK